MIYPNCWKMEEDELLKSMYLNGASLYEISSVLGRTLSAVNSRNFHVLKLKRKSEHLDISNYLGREGEEIAKHLFEEWNWKVLEKGEQNSVYDYIIEKEDGIYAINVKHGKELHFATNSKSVEKLLSVTGKAAYLLISDNYTIYFMPVIVKEWKFDE